jgi:cupin fold WbuC family metalloprotein
MSFENFTQDLDANTLSFYANNSLGLIQEEDIKEIIKLSKKTQDTARLSLHNSAENVLQLMLIYHPFKKQIGIKKYIETPSVYMLLEGEFILEFYNESKELTNSIHFSNGKTKIATVPMGQYYKMLILSNNLLFLEIRLGPFNKNKQIYLT